MAPESGGAGQTDEPQQPSKPHHPSAPNEHGSTEPEQGQGAPPQQQGDPSGPPPSYPAEPTPPTEPPQGGYPPSQQPSYPTEPAPPQYPTPPTEPPQGGYPPSQQPSYPTEPAPPQYPTPPTEPPQGGYPPSQQPSYPTEPAPPQYPTPPTEPPQGGYPPPQQPSYPTEPAPPQYPTPPTEPPQGGYPPSQQPSYPTEPAPPQYPTPPTEPPQGGYPPPQQPSYPTKPPQQRYPTESQQRDQPADDGQSSAPQGPASILDALKAMAAKAKADAAVSQKTSEALQDDIAKLETAYANVTKTVESYKNGRSALKQQLIEAKDWDKGPKPKDIIEAVADARRVQADDVWTQVSKAVTDLEGQREKLRRTLIAARHKQLDAEEARAMAGEALDEVEKRQTNLTDRLKRLVELQKEAQDAERAEDAYVRLLEYRRILALVGDQLLPVEEYRTVLEAAWLRVEQAQEQLRAAALELTQAQSAYDLAKSQYEQQDKNRVDETLKRLPPATSEPGAQNGTSGSGAPATKGESGTTSAAA